jgi:hypothetical protein
MVDGVIHVGYIGSDAISAHRTRHVAHVRNIDTAPTNQPASRRKPASIDVSLSMIARRDQAFAEVFYLSGWTQQQLAVREGMSQPWVVCRLRFARFIQIITSGNNPSLAHGLTEGRFRGRCRRETRRDSIRR